MYRWVALTLTVNLAEFPDLEERLQPSEMAVFLKAAGATGEADTGSIADCDCFSGLCGVIRHRLDQRSIEQIKLAAELFNWTIESGLFCCDTIARAVLQVGRVEHIAPFVLERILNRLPGDVKQGESEYDFRRTGFEQHFRPLAPVLTMLKESTESAGWVENQLALRIFFWIAEMYKLEVENQGG